MWQKTFDSRLKDWNNLRNQVQNLPVDQALSQVDQWWAMTPWSAYYLHWDDKNIWPDPWQLLDENIYCDLARGLGIMYTLMFMSRPELADARLQEYNNQNIVLACDEKYILNSSDLSIVNNNHKIKKTSHCIYLQELQKKFI